MHLPKGIKPASLSALSTSSATNAPHFALSLQRKREKNAQQRMPGKSNHGKNNTFKFRAKRSFPILAADAMSGMLGRDMALGTRCKTQVRGKIWARGWLLVFNP